MTAAARLLRSARRGAGLSQRTLAARAGIPQPTVASIERGRLNPRVDTLDRLLRAADRTLGTEPVIGEGVDVTLIQAMLRLTPAQRIRRLTTEARAMRSFDGARRVPRT